MTREQLENRNPEQASNLRPPAEIPDIAPTRLTRKSASQSTKSHFLRKPLQSPEGRPDVLEIYSSTLASSHREGPFPSFPQH